MKLVAKTGLISSIVGFCGMVLFHSVAPFWLLLICLGLLALFIGSESNNSNTVAPPTNSELIDGSKYSFIGEQTGIAVSPELKLIKLKERNNIKEYPFSDVRDWKVNLLSGGNAIGSGVAVASHNFANGRKNRLGGGLFVTVRDIDNPEWRIAILNRKEQNRWMEILTQLINES